jgi:hypothetical protein
MMSEESLRRFLKRLDTETDFREKVQKDWDSAMEEYDLSISEEAALAVGDEDALRRLMSAEVAGFGQELGWWFPSALCGPRTPNSGQHCGTGRCWTKHQSGCGGGTGNCIAKKKEY